MLSSNNSVQNYQHMRFDFVIVLFFTCPLSLITVIKGLALTFTDG